MKVLATATSLPPAESTIDPRFECLNRWSHLMMQIFESKQFLELAENTHKVHERSSLDEVLTQQGLFRAFLLSYGKCFSTSGKGRSSLDPNKVFAIDPTKMGSDTISSTG